MKTLQIQNRFKRPSNQGGEWLIAGSMKVNRVLNSDEVEEIAKKGKYIVGVE